MKYLLAPIVVDAVVLGEDQSVIGPEMDFSALPYFDATLKRDINSDSPYLAESIASSPFQMRAFS